MAGEMNVPTISYLLVNCALLSICLVGSVGAIDCFKCVSHNGDNLACEDPFHHNYTSELLHQPCLAGRKGREGLFPATACVKVTGTFEDSGDTMVVRTCALDSGTLTVDTELVRMSHCGSFYFDDRYVRGCVVSCTSDACNAASNLHRSFSQQFNVILQISPLINSMMYAMSAVILQCTVFNYIL